MRSLPKRSPLTSRGDQLGRPPGNCWGVDDAGSPRGGALVPSRASPTGTWVMLGLGMSLSPASASCPR